MTKYVGIYPNIFLSPFSNYFAPFVTVYDEVNYMNIIWSKAIYTSHHVIVQLRFSPDGSKIVAACNSQPIIFVVFDTVSGAVLY